MITRMNSSITGRLVVQLTTQWASEFGCSMASLKNTVLKYKNLTI